MSAVRPRILVIDDEPQIHRFLSPALDAAGYEPKRADSGQEGLRGIALWSPDAVVLDLGLPDMDGKEVLVRAREFYTGPVIILSARDREAEKIEALDLGANDYVEKPFGVGELLARIRAALRRSLQQTPEPVFTSNGLVVDLTRRRVTVDSLDVQLTPTEYDILRLLVTHAGKVLTHGQILKQVWGIAYLEQPHVLRVNVSNLRRKIEADPSRPRHIITEPGVGYRLAY